MRRASVAAEVPTAVSLPGAFPGTASATGSPGLPGYAPIPAGSVGPALNADGYFVGQIKGNLYWVTDSYYQAMFLTRGRTSCSSTHRPPSGTTCCGPSRR
ncbi:hypothetical protein QRX60_44420 [Amycolatopsis mongoliensis]|uniref:Uncharacterized protein n=1 Tax=Amycolatopsis mongoliensis TaxID=715475 RepID=A0A9Y2JLW0_9PSEU|nr:hypothetical protein [Amycolatopsis sp. 4-36]WIY01016.1 hypothetical protein QRX60_44420 [Amycolatopsis sp. 4-36]